MKIPTTTTVTTDNYKLPPTTRNDYLQKEGKQQLTPKDWKLFQICSNNQKYHKSKVVILQK